ncbi:MAG: CBS domain-containing protein [Terriglobales bacterium]
MNILELCDESPATVGPDATAAQAIQTMLDLRVGAVAVVDDQGLVAGIFTERDVLRKLALSGKSPAQTPVRDLMTTPVEMATIETSAGEALEVMVDRHIRHLPITDAGGRLLGILSIRNLLQSRVDDLTHQLDALETSLTNDAQGG